ncbi:hypothetical protein SDRG_00816 [Saprolegnia diclina VS20]|uniref:Fanconi anemia group D2 protein n=1 Tax=Saprolegnia diclina (strain VS20) TaxID=1156394 RepID=T0SGF6_SAPDV|nr:hypothetical protein SDRG_00816 [Saprolegnia diclina VS20]EQC41967.1 hypothetical protein SDRG_00816 [Saprolegnia diclina VS20]|eukprot:XP_008604536.1 hypothetical protein SDRG_00816 [Saprolegnia diclina VS20]
MERRRSMGQRQGMEGAWEVFWAEKEQAQELPSGDMSMFVGSSSGEEAATAVERAVKGVAPETALRDLEAIMGTPETLQRMLTVYDDSDSFIRILLRLDAIQTPLIDLLLEVLSEHAHQLETSIMSSAVCGLILRHIRWIEYISAPSELVQKFVGTLPTFPTSLQKDIIHILPELVPDTDFSMAVDALLEIISSESTLVVAAVEALGNFNIPAYQLEDVVTSVLNRLSSSPVEDLPPLVRFLVQASSSDNMVVILSQMREKLSQCITSSLQETTANDEALLLQQFVQGMTFRTDFMNAFLKMVTSIKTAEHHFLLDIWGLLGLHTLLHVRPKVESILKKKVVSGLFTKELLRAAIAGRLGALEPYFKNILQLLHVFFTSPDAHARDMGSYVLQLLFHEASRRPQHAYTYQSEMVTTVLGFCVTASPKTVDSGLETLLALLDHAPGCLTTFLPLLKQLLDYIDTFTVEQCRYVYQLLVHVGGTTDADLAITIRKQLYHQDNQYRKLGMIGYICVIEEEIINSAEASSIESTEDNSFDSPVQQLFVRKLRDGMEALKDACRKQPKCLAFMYAELNHLVCRIPQNTTAIQVISDGYSDILATQFLPNFDVLRHRNGDYKLAVMGGAFRTELWAILNSQSLVYLDLMNLIASSDTSDKEHLVYLCNLLHLVVSCSKRLDGLESIGTVLVCPIMLMEKSILSDVNELKAPVQEAICLCLWYAVNWCRDLLNCFCADVTLRPKVMARLENAVQFESMLLEIVTNLPPNTWTPPGVDVTTIADRAGAKESQKTLAATTKKGKGKQSVSATASQAKLKLVLRSLAPLHPSVMSILPDTQEDQGCIDPPSLVFLLSHFKEFLKTSVAKMHASPGFWAGAVTNRSRPILEHQAIEHERGLELFSAHLQPKLAAVKNNARWALASIDTDVDADESLRQVVIMYLQCIDLLGSSDVFRQQEAPQVQIDVLMDLILPKPMTGSNAFQAIKAMMGVLFELQQSSAIEDDLEVGLHFVRALATLEALKTSQGRGRQPQGVLFSSSKGNKDGDYRLGELAHEILKKNWWASAKANYKPSDVSMVLHAFLDNSGQPLDAIQELAIHGFGNLLEHPSASSETYPTLNKKTVGVHLRACCETLVRSTSRLDFSPGANDVPVLLHYLTQAALLFKFLVGLTKSFQSGPIIATVLKHASGFIENLLGAMPFFEAHFRSHSSRILKIMLEVQGGTRKLQILCAHGKSTLDASAAAHVPKMKKLLERVIYGGEKLARENNVMDAYTTGVLKHRNIDGSSIKTAAMPTTESEDNDDSDATHEESAQENPAPDDEDEEDEDDGE